MLAPEPGTGALDASAATVSEPALTLVGDTAVVEEAGAPGEGLGIGTWIAAGWLVLVALAAVFADLLPLDDPERADFLSIGTGPDGNHWLGTDEIGRDILSRAIYGGRISLMVGVVSVVLGVVVGGMFGLLAGYLRGITEHIVMLLTDALLAFPALVLLLCLAAVFGTNLPTLIIGLAVLTVPTFTRLTRANSLVVANREFVMASRAYGSKPMRVILRDIVPNVLMPVMAYCFIVMGVVIVAEGSLSFLGLGIPNPTPSWGGMIAGGRIDIGEKPHIVLIPGAVMFLTVLALTWLGERFRQRYDVKEAFL
jgi:peptide/nickel transport system permease protein